MEEVPVLHMGRTRSNHPIILSLVGSGALRLLFLYKEISMKDLIVKIETKSENCSCDESAELRDKIAAITDLLWYVMDGYYSENVAIELEKLGITEVEKDKNF